MKVAAAEDCEQLQYGHQTMYNYVCSLSKFMLYQTSSSDIAETALQGGLVLASFSAQNVCAQAVIFLNDVLILVEIQQ